jgi:hypothetical protein
MLRLLWTSKTTWLGVAGQPCIDCTAATCWNVELQQLEGGGEDEACQHFELVIDAPFSSLFRGVGVRSSLQSTRWNCRQNDSSRMTTTNSIQYKIPPEKCIYGYIACWKSLTRSLKKCCFILHSLLRASGRLVGHFALCGMQSINYPTTYCFYYCPADDGDVNLGTRQTLARRISATQKKCELAERALRLQLRAQQMTSRAKKDVLTAHERRVVCNKANK